VRGRVAVAKADPRCLKVYIDFSFLQQSCPRAMPPSVASSAKTCEPLKLKTGVSPHFESTPKRAPTALLWEEFRFKPTQR
jgi:hypothetical protein